MRWNENNDDRKHTKLKVIGWSTFPFRCLFLAFEGNQNQRQNFNGWSYRRRSSFSKTKCSRKCERNVVFWINENLSFSVLLNEYKCAKKKEDPSQVGNMKKKHFTFVIFYLRIYVSKATICIQQEKLSKVWQKDVKNIQNYLDKLILTA